MEREYKVGMYGGKFMPFHKGHLYCIQKAVEQCDLVYVLLFYGCDSEMKILKDNKDEDLEYHKRYETIKKVCKKYFKNKVIVKKIDVSNCKLPDGTEDWDAETPLVIKTMGKMDAVYSSEISYSAYFERAYPWAVHVLVDPPREVWPISRNGNQKYEKRGGEETMEAIKRKVTKEKIFQDKSNIFYNEREHRKVNIVENLVKSVKAIKWYEWVMMVIMIAIAAYSMITAFTNPKEGGNPPWLTIVNFVSAICGVVCVFLCAKASISNFAFATVNTIVYMIYLWYWKIYGTFFLELLVYFPINFISWYIWAKHRDEMQEEITKSKKLTWRQNLGVVIVVTLATIVYHEILVRVGGTVPWLDSMTVAIGIIAVVLEMLRYREQYVLWIVTDVVAVAMYIAHFDAVYLTKKSIYLIMAIIGLYNWWKLQKTRNAENR